MRRKKNITKRGKRFPPPLPKKVRRKNINGGKSKERKKKNTEHTNKQKQKINARKPAAAASLAFDVR